MIEQTHPHRVAIYRSELLPRSETFIQQQAQALRSWKPILIGRRLARNGLRLDGMDLLLTERTHIRPSVFAHRLRTLADLPDPSLAAALKELQVNLVHVHFGTDATDIWPSVRQAGLPLLVTLHGYDINIHMEWWKSGNGGLHRRTYPHRLLRMALHPDVRFVAVSEAIKGRAIEVGIPEHRITVCHIGVDTARFKPGPIPLPERRKRILFVGRMVEKKAPLLLIQAFFEAKKTISDAELVMIGDGPLLPEAIRIARELDISVEFMGARNTDEVLEQLHLARIFCLPSTTASNGDAEGLPISLLEAQASGVPCITTNHSGNPEAIIDGVTGRVIAPGSVSELTDALTELLSDGILADDYALAASRHIHANFHLSQMTGHLEQTYDRFLRARQGEMPRQ